jgi:chromate transporter
VKRQSVWKFLAGMLKVGVVGFGGDSALIPVIAKEVVAPGKLSREQFAQDTVIANITPGALQVKRATLAGTRLWNPVVAGAVSVALPGTL